MGFQAQNITGSSPSLSYRDRGGGYKWKGHQDWQPGHPDYRDEPGRRRGPQGNAVVRAEEKQARIAVFAEARADDVPVAEAGQRAGVGRKTAMRYEQERLAGEAQDG